MKISDHELRKLKQKSSVMRPARTIQDIARDVDHLAKLILRRHGVSEKTHHIDLATGEILLKGDNVKG